MKTEEAIYSEAVRIKKASPDTKVIFYLATDQQGLNCYKCADTFNAHPEWWLKLDNGTAIGKYGTHQLDCTVAAARDWWTSLPLLGDDGKGNYKGQPVSELIDGVLADSGGWSNYPGVSLARLEALADGKAQMIGDLQAKLTAANGGIVMANGVGGCGAADGLCAVASLCAAASAAACAAASAACAACVLLPLTLPPNALPLTKALRARALVPGDHTLTSHCPRSACTAARTRTLAPPRTTTSRSSTTRTPS